MNGLTRYSLSAVLWTTISNLKIAINKHSIAKTYPKQKKKVIYIFKHKSNTNWHY